MSETLAKILCDAGQSPRVDSLPDGSTVLILPHGGRILGLFAPESDENFFWTHPDLASVASARAFFASEQWHNSGGDRTWLAPEVDIFLPNYPSTDGYWQPRQLDPGEYQLVEGDGPPRLVNRLSITLSRSGRTVDLEMTKSVGPAANPLRHERGFAGQGDVEYAGYTLHTSLEWRAGNGAAADRVGLWNLVQFPHGGDLLVATHARTTPKVCFGNIAAEDLIVRDHMLRYRMRAAGEHKIDIRAAAITGRIGYVYETGGRWALIVRNFFVDLSGEYVDVPWGDADDLGYAAQACNVNSALGSFSELEYHVPAIGGDGGPRRCDDASQIWAFRGPERKIRAAAAMILGAGI
jgi:hypothetical protein